MQSRSAKVIRTNKFEISVFLAILAGWILLLSGYTHQAFYSIGILIVIVLLGIMDYLRMIYMDKK